MKLTERDRARMEGVHPDLVAVFERAAQDGGIDFVILEGVRTVARQRQLVAKGASRTMNSRHIPGQNGVAHAIDAAPLANGRVSWDWKHYYPLAKVIKAAAEKLGVPVEWGGDWRSFKDGPHWQLPWKLYPADAAVEVRSDEPMGLGHAETQEPAAGSSQRFDVVIPLVLAHEGEFVDHPDDDGGPTNKGITIATFRRHIKPFGTVADLKAMTTAQAVIVYRHEYWDKVSASSLPTGVDYAVFDFAVNSGPRRATKFLQRVVGVADDGRIGPVTLAAVRAMTPVAIIDRLCDERMAYLEGHDDWPAFKNGWTKRVDRVRDGALDMARNVGVPPPDPKPEPSSPDLTDRQPDDPGPDPAPPGGKQLSPLGALFAALFSWLLGRGK